MDTLPPSPDTALLLSAQEAKAQLRGIVEGFCFRRLRNEDGKGPPDACSSKVRRVGQDEDPAVRWISRGQEDWLGRPWPTIF